MNKPEFNIIPAQKTFSFDPGISDESIDEVVNRWIRVQNDNGTPVHLGKTFSNHNTGRTYYVFMYSIKEKVK